MAQQLLDVPGTPPSDHMDFGRLAPFISRSQRSLPSVVAGRSLALQELAPKRFGRANEKLPVRVAQLLWAVPGGFFQIMTTVDVDTNVHGAIALLEDLYYDEFCLNAGAVRAFGQWLGDDGGWNGESNSPETHQLVFFPSSWNLEWEQVQRIVYRADMDAVRDHSAIEFPDELNRRPGRGGALTPFVSVFWGQQDYIENCAILSAVQLVSAWARARHIRDVTYTQFATVQHSMKTLHEGYANPTRRAEIRRVLACADELISELEARLTFGVEAVESILPVVPSLRVEAYHRSLYTSLDLPRQAGIASKMLARLTSAVRSESAALQSLEDHVAELRRRRWAISIGFLSTIAIPLTILLGFFGAGTSDVRSDASLFDLRAYRRFYAVTVAVVAVSLAVHLTLLYRGRRRMPLSRSRRREAAGLGHVDDITRGDDA